MAAGEGFEPSQTESESVVLPLHNPAIWAILVRTDAIIPDLEGMSIADFQFVKKSGQHFQPSGLFSLLHKNC